MPPCIEEAKAALGESLHEQMFGAPISSVEAENHHKYTTSHGFLECCARGFESDVNLDMIAGLQ